MLTRNLTRMSRFSSKNARKSGYTLGSAGLKLQAPALAGACSFKSIAPDLSFGCRY
jgi:hypothetical protein